MKILNLIQVKRKESLIRRLVKNEISMNKNILNKSNKSERYKKAYTMLATDLFIKSYVDKNNSNELWTMFILPLLYPFCNMFGFNNDYGKQFLEDVLNKTKEEYDKELNKDI